MSDIPHDTEAEECILGAMLLNYQAIDVVSDAMVSTDFYTPGYGLLFDTIVSMHANGIKADTLTVADALVRGGVMDRVGDSGTLIQLTINTPSKSPESARRYAEIVLDHSLRRRLMAEGSELAHMARDMSADATDVLESHLAMMSTIGSALIDTEPDDISVEEFVELHRETDPKAKWVIHGLIRKQHKLMIVAGESHGKSVLMRYVAICAAYGIQPFRHTPETPIRTLIVDLENPSDALTESFEMILKKVRVEAPNDDTANRLWWRPEGIDLRNRVDLARLENVIRTRRPQLVCLGPMYCAFDTKPGEHWETPAKAVQRALKALMVRYDFALILEDHAPQADASGNRNLRPYGSSFWMRWLDIQLGMSPINEEATAFEMQVKKGRVGTDWPKFLTRGDVSGSSWPWVPRWE